MSVAQRAAHPIHAELRRTFDLVLDLPQVTQFLESNSLGPGDYVLFNNSFLHRGKLDTSKSNYVMAARHEVGGLRRAPELVLLGRRSFNTDLAHMRAREPVSNGEVVSLHSALLEQVESLGTVVFSLIGKVDYSSTFDVALAKFGARTRLFLNPQAKSLVAAVQDALVVQSVSDPDQVVQFAEATLGELTEDQNRELRNALSLLDEQAFAPLQIPLPGQARGASLLSDICGMLRAHRQEYNEALDLCSGTAEKNRRAFNDVLRISYNFVSDTRTMLDLIVSVCDLKPIVLWLTLRQHISLSQALRALPWVRGNKPSLEEYEGAVRDARNNAFHSLISFDRGLRVALPDEAIRGAVIHTFARHKKKSKNRLEYPDQQLVDLLVEFTRPEQRTLSARFWEKNLAVMDATIDLFDAIESSLWSLFSAKHGAP